MSKCRIYNSDCEIVMNLMNEYNEKVDIILTSPPYNTGRSCLGEDSRKHHRSRYDVYMESKTQEEYCEWCVNLFNKFDTILKENGVILWNISYGSDSESPEGIGQMWLSIADIIRYTNFIVADRIIWKKKSALPNNRSSNKLTRIVEDVFVLCRKSEYKTFNANKEISKTGKNGSIYYKNYYNFIEAKNNDGSCDLNKATFSSDLVKELLDLYATENMIIFDPFNGTGTTGVACINKKCIYYGAEISEAQCEYSKNRLLQFEQDVKIIKF